MQAITGTRDGTYNLLSMLYHTLQAAEQSARSIEDAERAGDREAADFFRAELEEDRRRADRAKQLLKARLGQAGMGNATPPRQRARDEVEQASMDSFPASDAPANY